MIDLPNWAKMKAIVDGLGSATKVCTGDDSHYMLYVAKDGLVMSYRLNKAIAGEQAADPGLAEFEASYITTFF